MRKNALDGNSGIGIVISYITGIELFVDGGMAQIRGEIPCAK